MEGPFRGVRKGTRKRDKTTTVGIKRTKGKILCEQKQQLPYQGLRDNSLIGKDVN